MTIDQNQTPAESEETAAAQTPDDTAATVTDTAEVAPTPDAATAPEPTPEVVSEAPADAPVAEPVAETPVTADAATAPESPAPAPIEEVPAPVAPAPAASAPVTTANDMDLFESYMSGGFTVEGDANEGGFKRLQRGERIEATIIQVDADKVFVDLGTKAEGIVPLSELSEENLTTAEGHFNVGDKIQVVVLRPEGAEGNPIVSKKRADFEEVWDRIERAHRSEELVTATVVDRVKGGLVVDIGVRGFVPATHVGSGKLRNIEKFLGQTLSLKVIEIDRDRKKVVLSNRQAEEERKQVAKEEIFTNVKPGDVLEGTVRRLADYGAFVDLGGVDGLLHISEMSWARINHPKEMFKEGQKIKVMVLRLDPGAGKISLGHRQVLPDPWNLIRENYKNGQKLTVTIGRIVQSGAFIKLPEGAEAFMPMSEMSPRRIRRPQDVVDEGQDVECQIIDLRPEERRMVLSMRAVGGGMELKPGATEGMSGFEEDMRRGDGKRGGDRRKGGRRDGDYEDAGGRRGVATGGATIGERLGALKGLLNRTEESEESTDSPEESA